MTLTFEFVLAYIAVMCFGYATSRPKSKALWVGLILYISSICSAFFIEKIPITPILPTFPLEFTYTMKAIVYIIITGSALIFLVTAFGIGYYIGKIVNNVEKYQRK